MAVIRSLSLKRWIPSLFLISSVLMVTLMASFEYLHTAGKIQEQMHRHGQELMAQLALPLRRALEEGKDSDIKALFGNVMVRSDVAALALTDSARHVLYASHFAWQDLLIDDVLPRANRLTGQNNLLDSSMLMTLPIQYSSHEGELRNTHTLTLWLLMDSSSHKQRTQHEILLRGLLIVIPSLIILLLILWLSQRYISRPTQRLLQYANRLEDGDYTAQQETKGTGELARLSLALTSLAQKTASTIKDLKDREQRLSVTLDAIGDAVMVTDTQGLVTRLNPMAEQLTGWSEIEATGRPVIEVFQIVNASTRQPVEHPVSRVLREGAVVGLANHTVLISRDGTEYQIADSAAPIPDDTGKHIVGIIMVFQDVTQRYEMEADLATAHTELKAMTRALPDPCFLLDEDGKYLEIYGGEEHLLADTRKTLLGQTISRVLPEKVAGSLMEVIKTTLKTGLPQIHEYTLETPSGTHRFEGHTNPLVYNGDAAVIWLARDITRRWQAEQDVSKLVNYDPLTGLPNRRLLETQLQQALSRARRSEYYSAILFIDLDHFKTINDSLGHQYGDRILVALSRLLSEGVRAGDHIARFGGDEFIVVLEDLGKDLRAASGHAESIALKLNDNCNGPMQLDGQEVQISLSTGIVIFPDHADADELIKRADIAMYRAKDTGRNRVCFFSADLQETAEQRLSIQNELREAITRDQLRLYAQPKANHLGQWVSCEILVRWQHPERGLLTPNLFVPIAEETGLIVDLDYWVIQHAIAALGEQAFDSLPANFEGLSINVSGPTMAHAGFAGDIKFALARASVDSHRVELEITERLLLHDYHGSSEVMDELHQTGLRFSIDDFGTGYSSLRYLQRLPIDTLKIDQSFVSRLPQNSGDATLVESILDLADHLGLQTVAEGIESTQQQTFLAERGCQQFQGYLYARPMPWDEFVNCLQD